jgi:hypothetical protein
MITHTHNGVFWTSNPCHASTTRTIKSTMWLRVLLKPIVPRLPYLVRYIRIFGQELSRDFFPHWLLITGGKTSDWTKPPVVFIVVFLKNKSPTLDSNPVCIRCHHSAGVHILEQLSVFQQSGEKTIPRMSDKLWISIIHEGLCQLMKGYAILLGIP